MNEKKTWGFKVSYAGIQNQTDLPKSESVTKDS